MSALAERLLAIHSSLDRAGIPHAFGGAIALAYCTRDPRGTHDIDVNVFVGVDRIKEVFDAMPEAVVVGSRDVAAARKDGQVRLWWDDTPVDVFFDTDQFHREVEQGVVEVPFDGATIKVLGCDAVVMFKAMFNRTRDWGDIEAVLNAGTIDGHRVVERLRSLLGASDPALLRLSALVEARS